MSTRFDYLIVGGGMAADAAARGIRELDTSHSIGILSEDIDAPYTRPALTKKLWTDPDFSWEQVPLGTIDDTGASLLTSTRVTALDRGAKTVTTDAGETFEYDSLLLATGGHPKQIDLPEDERVIYFRSADDYRRLREFANAHAHVGVVGGSYIGTELAAALIQNGCEVTLVFPEETLGGSIFPADLARKFEKQFADAGVRLRRNASVNSAEADGAQITLELDDGSNVSVDAVVSGLGIVPAIDLAEAASLETMSGIVVDSRLRTSDASIYAAGDVAEYPDAILGRRRVEHVDNANEMGAAVGRIMAGDTHPYTHTPYYYSVVFDSSYEAVGTLDASLETVEDWATPLEQGVVYYLDGEVAVGVLLWNVEGKRDAARRILASARSITRDRLPGMIPPDGGAEGGAESSAGAK